METTLHRQLKAIYGGEESQQEVSVDGYRIDAVAGDVLIEIQYGSLGAIRDKVAALCQKHRVLVVKPLAARKYLIRRDRKGGPIASARYSPVRETYADVFLDLVHFVTVFPHAQLTLEVLLTEQEEHRIAKRSRRWARKDYRVEDRLLREIVGRRRLNSANDLLQLLPAAIPSRFTTSELAQVAEIPRWLAQKAAYCLRLTGEATPVAKQGNAIVYELTAKPAPVRKRAARSRRAA